MKYAAFIIMIVALAIAIIIFGMVTLVNAQTSPGWVLIECPISGLPCHPYNADKREPKVFIEQTACLLDLASVANVAAPGTRFSCERNRS